MDGPKFEFYVLNEDSNRGEIEKYNIFNNIIVYERTLKAVKKYCRSSKKYKYKDWFSTDEYYGFDAFCKELRLIILSEEWSRCEYEIVVASLFSTDIDDLIKVASKYISEGKSLEEFGSYLVDVSLKEKGFTKTDCYQQARPNLPMIAREVIYQYKEWKKLQG